MESQSGCPNGGTGSKNQGFVPDGKDPAMLIQGRRQQLTQQCLQLQQGLGAVYEVAVFTSKQFVNSQGIVHKLLNGFIYEHHTFFK